MTLRDSSPARDLLPGAPDALSLDFANTRYWRGREAPVETLVDDDALFTWVHQNHVTTPAALAVMRRVADESASQGEALLPRVLVLREAIYSVFASRADGVVPPSRELTRLNAALADAPVRGRLVADADRWSWRVSNGEPRLPLLLTGVLWSAGDLLTGARLARVRQCANPECLWLFLDDSKSANRRWCQMSGCGNRAKARRYYERHKAAS